MIRIYFFYFTVLCSCQQEAKQYEPPEGLITKLNMAQEIHTVKIDTSNLERTFIKAGLVSITNYDSSILVSLQYADTHNFMHRNLYGNLKKAYIRKELVQQLKSASRELQLQFPQLRLMILDAARPLHVQQMMWDSVNLPKSKRAKYLMNPKKISGHNYGISLDVTLYDLDQKKCLDMGSNFDHFGDESEPRYELRLLAEGKLTQDHIQNRTLLRSVMHQAAFQGIVSEWWHFNAMSREQASNLYSVVP